MLAINHVLKRIGLSLAFGLGLLVLVMVPLAGATQPEPSLTLDAGIAPASISVQVVTKTWENLGLYGAIVSAIAIDPVNNAPTGTVLIGTTSGSGLYRSLDGGLTWEGISGYGSVQGLAVNTVDGVVWAKSEAGLITSADGGSAWHIVPTPPGIPNWGSLVVSGSLTVLGGEGIVAYTLDYGTTWLTTTLPCRTCSVGVEIDRLNDYIYAASYDEIYRSPITPLNFITSSGMLTSSHGMNNIISLGASPHISGLVYAGTGDLGQRALYRSDDGGVSWTQLYSERAGVGYIVFHPVLTQTVYAGGQQSSDGLHFTPMASGAGNSHFAIYPTAPYTMFGAVDQGINRSTDGGASFQPVNTGIDGVVVVDFTQNPRDLGLFFVNTKSGLGRTFDGGQTWDFPIGASHFGGAVLAPYYAAVNTQKVFLGEHFSSDYGDTMQNLGSPSLRSLIERSGCTGQCFAFINAVAANPANDDHLYAASGGAYIPPGGEQQLAFGGLWESTDGGITWVSNTVDYSATYGTLPYTTPVKTVLFATDDLAYAALGDFKKDQTGGFPIVGGVVSRTTGGNWQLLATITNPITSMVESLAVDPNNPRHIWAGTSSAVGMSGRLYRSTDGGVSWEDRTPPGGHGPFTAIAIHPRRSNVIFAATGQQVYFSTNAGATWALISSPPATTAEAIEQILLPILPPAPVLNLTGTVTGGDVVLSWTNPTDPKFQGVHIRRSTTAPPRTSVEGTAVVTLTAAYTSYTVTLSGSIDFLTVFPYDSQGRYGVGTRLVVSNTQVLPAGAGGAGRVAILNADEIARAAEEANTSYLFVGTDQGLYRTEIGDLISYYEVFLPLVLKK